MKKLLFLSLLGLLWAGPAWAPDGDRVANGVCSAATVPFECCTGVATGTCNTGGSRGTWTAVTVVLCENRGATSTANCIYDLFDVGATDATTDIDRSPGIPDIIVVSRAADNAACTTGGDPTFTVTGGDTVTADGVNDLATLNDSVTSFRTTNPLFRFIQVVPDTNTACEDVVDVYLTLWYEDD